MYSSNIVAILFGIPLLIACGNRPPHGVGGTGGIGGSAGMAGTGGSAGTGGEPTSTLCTGANPSQTCDPGCIGEVCLSKYCEVTHRFVAHGPVAGSKYQVAAGTVSEHRCFNFKNPLYDTDAQITAETPIFDAANDPLLTQHWALFGSTVPVEDGSISGPGCLTPDIRDRLIARGSQGATAYVLGSDIGLMINRYPYLILQVHYDNRERPTQADASGVAFCTTPTPRKYAAGLVTLGTDDIFVPGGGTGISGVLGGTGTCGPNVGGTGLAKRNRPVYVIGSSPHMHQIGSGFTTTHWRGDVKLGTISNVPDGTWKYDSQAKSLRSPVEVRPGDTLTTECFYRNPSPQFVAFGIGRDSEQCNDFLLVYPAADTRAECGQGIGFDNELDFN